MDCFASALRPPTQRAAEPSPRPSFVINVRGGAANRSLAVLATAAAVRGAGSWRALLEAGAQAKEGGQAGQAGRGGAAPAAAAMAMAMAVAVAVGAAGRVAVAVAWLPN